MAIHEALLTSERTLLRYESSFLEFHEPTGKRLKSDQYSLDDKLMSASEVLEKALFVVVN